MRDDVLQAVREFVDLFEEVFDRDWIYTKEMLGIHDETPEQKIAWQEMGLEAIPVISEDGTFLRPRVDDETSDWGHRGKLLKNYRKLKRLLAANASTRNPDRLSDSD